MEFSEILTEIQKDSVGYRPDYLFSIYYLTTLLPQPFTVVEIGCHRGDSTISLAAGARHPDSKIYSIDPVFTAGSVRVPDEHQKNGHIYESSEELVMGRLKKFNLGEFVTLIPGYSWDVLPGWEEQHKEWPDLILVDGEHTYGAIQRDCQWMEIVKPGGLAAFDDWFFEIKKSVEDYIQARPEWQMIHESIYGPWPNGFNLTFLRKDA